MLATLARGLPAVPVLAGTAEAIPLAGASVDAIVAGAAFHWFARPAADAQMARVLRPGGSAALLWNPVDPGHPLGQVFTRARRSLGLDPREYDPDVELDRRWFGPTRRRIVGSELTTTVDDFLAQLGSRSYLLTAGPGERARILAEAGAVAAAYAVAGRLTVPVRTTVLHARTRG
jgi:SAM-dependent methyltransferase